jgi:hypothetical protein
MTLALPKTLREFPAGAIYNRQIEKTIPADGLDTLRLNAQVLGNTLLCFDADGEASVVAAGDPVLMPSRVEREGNTLVVEGRNLKAYARHGQKQKILIEIHVPPSTKVEATFTGGVLILNGGEGEVTINGRFGEVAGVTQSRQVAIHIGGGAVELNELPGEAEIDLSVGSATLGWTELRGTERVRVHCALGAVDLVLPPGIAPVEDQGGVGKQKWVRTPAGSEISAKVGFGGLDIYDWAIALPED